MSNEEEIPLIEHEEKDDDDDDDDTTHPFQPDVHSTPGPSGEEIPKTTMNREKEKGPASAETSFIEGNISRRNKKITLANLTLEQKYPEYGKNNKSLILEVSKGKYPGKVVVIGPRGGQIPLFKADGRTINPPKLPKTDMKLLDQSAKRGLLKRIKKFQSCRNPFEKMKKSQIMKMNNPQ